MWIGEIRFAVQTKDASYAGTDSMVDAVLLRDEEELVTLGLNRKGVNDLQRGSMDEFIFRDLPRHNDRTFGLPPSSVQIPMPYPPTGIEFSDGLPGHLKFRLIIEGNDLWIKDKVVISIKQFRFTFEAQDWVLDQNWSVIGSWGRDAKMSTDFWEGDNQWILVL
jgi:hypothetical protein